jgi:hypothetical protein
MLLLLAPSWVLGALEFPAEVVQAPIPTVVAITTSALDLLACWLLFFGFGARSYFRQAETTGSQAGES